jgi:predicted phage terminase large subunit-like protein
MSSENVRKLFEFRREQWHRLCRQNLLACATQLLEPRGMVPARHHELFCREVEAVVHGQVPRLILISPRGSAKSTYASHIAPAWLFALRSGARIITVSHTQELAESNSRAVMRFINENSLLLGYELANDAAGRWSTTNGCEFRAVGVGQPARGSRADLIIVDDPIRSRAEAESETARNSLWEYFHSDLLPCLLPRAGVVAIGTVYHENDLMCRLEREQSDLWRVLRLPAISEGDGDPLDRPEGVPLWADDPAFGYGARLLEMQDEYIRYGRTSDWASQFQGRPRPPEGAMFKPGKMPFFDELPPGVRVLDEVRAWDLAASSGRGDYTVGMKLARLHGDPRWSDLTLITDVQRMRGAPEEVRHLIRTVAAADGPRVTQWFPEDPGQSGRVQAEDLVRMLSGYSVKTERMSGSKETRADPAASQCNIGRVGMLRASWNAALIDELASFPVGVHDDQVDALSLGFEKVAAKASKYAKWIALAS